MGSTAKIKGFFSKKKVLVTAGPTYEAIDPVRYIANRSSGKMGYALAEAATAAGADVTLISGPVSLTPPLVSKLIKINNMIFMLPLLAMLIPIMLKFNNTEISSIRDKE